MSSRQICIRAQRCNDICQLNVLFSVIEVIGVYDLRERAVVIQDNENSSATGTCQTLSHKAANSPENIFLHTISLYLFLFLFLFVDRYVFFGARGAVNEINSA